MSLASCYKCLLDKEGHKDQRYKDTKDTKTNGTKAQRYKNTKKQRHKDTKTQSYKDSTIQRHKETKTHYNMYNMINTQHCLNVHRSNTNAAKSFSHHEHISFIIFPVKDGNIKSICQSLHG